MIRCVLSKVNWNKPISAGTYEEDVLISVDKSPPVLTNSRHKNAYSGATQCGRVPLPFKRDRSWGRQRRKRGAPRTRARVPNRGRGRAYYPGIGVKIDGCLP